MKRISQIHHPLKGDITVPGDKSIAHRAVILASIARGRSRIFNLSRGEDNSRTVRAFREMGVALCREEEALCVDGQGWDGLRPPTRTIDCGNSGTTMRLLSGLLCGRPFRSCLDGDDSLRRRPMQRVIDPLTQMGAKIASQGQNGLAPLEIYGGGLHGIHYRMGIASAQVKSAILLAALQAEGMTTVEEPLKSRDHTEVLLRGFGAEVSVNCKIVALKGRQSLSGREVKIPGDLSSAAFFLVAAAAIADSDVVIRGVGRNPTRDGVLEVLGRMGASIEVMDRRTEAGEVVVDLRVRGEDLKGVDVGPEMVARTIDEYPILAVAAALADGVTTFSDVRELRYKESDRIAAMTEALRRLGVKVEEHKDSMKIYGGKKLQGARVRSFADHRIAMALAIAGLSSAGGVEIDDVRCVDISFPSFFQLLEKLSLP